MTRILLALFVVVFASPAIAQNSIFPGGEPEEEQNIRYVYEDKTIEVTHSHLSPQTPPTLDDIKTIERQNVTIGDSGMPLDIRKDALIEAAVSYGARAGLAARTYEIGRETEGRARYLDKVFNFSELLIPAPSGLLIEPPIVNESINAMLIEGDGQQAAVSDRIYNIINNARIVSTPRNWRTYLEREWGGIEPPPDVLLPEVNDDEERAIWIEHVEIGWDQGMRQANEIFEADLNLLTADFEGMIRYRKLLTQGMISPPYALQVDRGVAVMKCVLAIVPSKLQAFQPS